MSREMTIVRSEYSTWCNVYLSVMPLLPLERDAVGRDRGEHDQGGRRGLQVGLDDHGGRRGARTPVHVHGVDAELVGMGVGEEGGLGVM